MKKLHILMIATIALISTATFAQTKVPEGYVKGTITLLNHSSIEGYIKDEMSSRATIVFIANNQTKKEQIKGEQLLNITINNDNYICIKGDFFKKIVTGDYNFLQKISDAAAIPTYVGTEAFFINGTEGKPGNYFLYHAATQNLQLVNKKNVAKIVAHAFNGNAAAIAKAKESEQNIQALQYAVILFNQPIN